MINRFKFVRNAFYDSARYYRWSTAFRAPLTREQLRANLTFEYHKIEKGLALPETRPGFGGEVIMTLIRDIGTYEKSFGPDDMSIIVRDVLTEYRQAFDSDPAIMRAIDSFLASETPNAKNSRKGGTITFQREQFFRHDAIDALSFLKSRRSARQFTGARIANADIEEVIAVAQEAPSVCNRQAGFVFSATEPEIIKQVLSFQNGNRGFGHLLGAVLVVTADTSRFRSVGERYQPFIDGGIFAMAIVNALHAKHIGACMLNWSAEHDRDKKLRAALGIADRYAIITMIGCGEVPPTIQVAASPRDPSALQWLGTK